MLFNNSPPPPPAATAAVGMHPTGMHSCFRIIFDEWMNVPKGQTHCCYGDDEIFKYFLFIRVKRNLFTGAMFLFEDKQIVKD